MGIFVFESYLIGGDDDGDELNTAAKIVCNDLSSNQ